MVSMIWITSSSPTVTSKVVGSGLTPARLGTSGMEIEALPTRDGAVLTQLHYSPKVSCDCRTGFDVYMIFMRQHTTAAIVLNVLYF